MPGEQADNFADILWQIHSNRVRPDPWQGGGNLPWDEPGFSERMLREHLDESHSAATRTAPERAAQLEWLWSNLELRKGSTVLDVACGPGLYAVPLAERGCRVTGVDFSPASIAYARELARDRGVSDRCSFIEQDLRAMDISGERFDAVLLLYGQLAVFPVQEARDLLRRVAASLHRGGKLYLEFPDEEALDHQTGRSWSSADRGLWGDTPYISLHEQWWDEAARLSTERFRIIHIEEQRLTEVVLSHQSYSVAKLRNMLTADGFSSVDVYPAHGFLPLSDAERWNVFVATR